MSDNFRRLDADAGGIVEPARTWFAALRDGVRRCAARARLPFRNARPPPSAALAADGGTSPAAAASSEAQFALFVEHAPAAIAMFDRDMRYLAASRRMTADYGLPEGIGLIGRSHYEIFPEIPQRWRDIHARVLAGEELSCDEDPFLRADGRMDWIRWSMRPWRDAAGNIAGATLFSEVITGQVEARRARQVVEARLRENEERLRLALEGAQMGMWVWEVGTDRSVWNAREFELLGVPDTGGEVDTGRFFDCVHPDDLPELEKILAEVLRTGEDFAHEFRVVLPDGTIRWLAGRGRLLRGAAGARMLGTNWDVTDKKRAEAALRESEEHYRCTIELSPQNPWTADPTGAFISFTDRWLEWTGQSREDAVRLGWAHVVHPDDLPRCMQQWGHAVATGEPADVRYRLRMADGSYRWMRGRAFPRRGEPTAEHPEGPIIRWYGTTEDIDDQMRTEQQQRELKMELLHATRLTTMGEMAATLAHELAQPLAATAGYVEGCERLLRSGRPDARELVLAGLGEVLHQATRAGEILKRLRGFVRKGSEHETAAREPADLDALVREAAALALAGADRLGIRVIWELAPNLPPVVVDRVQVSQIVVNLVRNAVDALTQASRRELRIATAITADGETIAVSFADSGPGLPPEGGAGLFEPFVTTKHDGLGLGLKICRSIAEAHGGRIWAEPNQGGGAVFTFTLPL
ncbi:PAS domain-containing protein [Benzoatithermus flavus]|uniref:histidine kinase n=1 Tax=Benzoatithermus flavus TaxID=3108223 RepID=A0ABU8XWK9_9PROT